MDVFKKTNKTDQKLQDELIRIIANSMSDRRTFFFCPHVFVDNAGLPFSKRFSSSR